MRLTSTVEVRLSGWVSSTTTLCMTLRDILQSQETTGIQPCFDCSGRRLSAPPSGAVKARLSKLHNVVVLVAISSESGSATEFRGDSGLRRRDSFLDRCCLHGVSSKRSSASLLQDRNAAKWTFLECRTIRLEFRRS